jgi:hypothetical protein
MMPLSDITGLAGIALAITALVLRLPVAARLQSGLQAWLAGAILVALAIPFGGMSGAEYVRGITGDLSIATLALLLPLVLPRTNGRAPSRAKTLSEFNLTLLLLACAAVALYPMALGIGMFDPYRLGFGNLWFIAGLLFMASAAWIRQYTLIALGLSLAVLAWSVGWYESNNIWNYLLDPWVSIYALGVLIKRGTSIAAKLIFRLR